MCVYIYVHIYTLIYSACSVHVDSEICAHTSYIYIYIHMCICIHIHVCTQVPGERLVLLNTKRSKVKRRIWMPYDTLNSTRWTCIALDYLSTMRDTSNFYDIPLLS